MVFLGGAVTTALAWVALSKRRPTPSQPSTKTEVDLELAHRETEAIQPPDRLEGIEAAKKYLREKGKIQ